LNELIVFKEKILVKLEISNQESEKHLDFENINVIFYKFLFFLKTINIFKFISSEII
jgi:hypothetical protein